MTAMHACLIAVTLQVVLLSMVYPAHLMRRLRAELTRFATPQTPSLLRALHGYGAANAVVAVAGGLLLTGLYRYMQRADWSDGPVEALLTAYFLAQMLPLAIVARISSRLSRAIRDATSHQKRRASLEPRRLFDFVPRGAVAAAMILYLLFVGFMLYLARHPFPGFAGAAVNIGGITLVYLLLSGALYFTLYGRRRHPLQTSTQHLRLIGFIARTCVLAGMLCVLSVMLNFTLVLQDAQRWEPATQSLFFTLCALLSLGALKADAGGAFSGSSPPSTVTS